jgi:hypothetical protein
LRVRAFETKFGRLPKPDEPIFFDESLTHPAKASTNEVRAQLERGAREARVDLDPVLHFLGLSYRPTSIPRSRADTLARRGGAHSVQSNRRDSDSSTGGNGFLTNERLHRRHRITREELQTLSAASFLGEATERDYLLVLETIRLQGK